MTIKVFFLSMFLGLPVKAFDSCKNVFSIPEMSHEQNVIEEVLRPLWNPDLLSDPKSHNPNDFLYIIRVPKGTTEKELYYDVRQPVLSASLIGNIPGIGSFAGSFLNKGWALILKVRAQKIIASLPQDSGQMALTSNRGAMSDKEIREFQQRYGFYSPRELLSASILRADILKKANPHSQEIPINEIFLKGEDVEIIGIAHFPGRKFIYGGVEPEINNTIETIAQRLQIPVIKIGHPK